MSQHCILILAHRLPWLFQRLVASLSGHFQVIGHVDAGADRRDFAAAGAVLVPSSHRIRWGSFAMVAATLDMLRQGLEDADNRTFTLVSGDTYPLAAPADIAASLDQEVDRIDSHIVRDSSETMQRIVNVFLPDTRLGELRPGMHFLHRHLEEDLTQVMAEAERARRNRPAFLKEFQYAKGAQWWSLTRPTVERIVALADGHPLFVDALRFSAIPDEAFFQTAIANLGLHDSIRPGPVYAKWDTVPAPHTFETREDLEILRAEKRPFARKFGEGSRQLIDMIEEELWSRAFSLA